MHMIKHIKQIAVLVSVAHREAEILEQMLINKIKLSKFIMHECSKNPQ
jgi:hypothetical protein